MVSYTMNTNWTAADSRLQIRIELERWNPRYGTPAVDLDTIDFPKARVEVTKAAVHFALRGVNIKIECDSQASYKQNIRCVCYAVNAMRMNEKRGIADTMARAYLQLEAPKEQRDPYVVLQVRPDASIEIVEASYKALAKRHHPDKGGDAKMFKEIQDAYDRVKKERKVATPA